MPATHCFSKIQIGFTSLVPAQPDNPGQSPESRKADVCVCVLITLMLTLFPYWQWAITKDKI